MKKTLVASLFLFLITLCASAQVQLKLPQASPRNKITATIGVTEITLDYGAPGVKNREVWGKLVPYGQIWRAGANEATTITFSTEARMLQENIPAGTYSLFVLLTDPENALLVLSKQKGLWGTEGYDPKQDVVRVPMTAQAAPFHETLQYSIKDIQPSSGRLTLNWAEKQWSAPIRVETHSFAMKAIKDSLAMAKPTDWSAYAQAVNYLLQQNQDHEQALTWINKSLAIEENFYNTWLKAKLLAQKNEYETALELNKKAQKLGKKTMESYQAYSKEIQEAEQIWKEKRFNVN
ncbi:DUF2911 domain-containing protein [Rufibacter ruber]|uniref:DUF2911 domain-containing protein n=1 Tax=Rufibacter ruber TaxID=1783499 RepID=UPI000831356C|nr:DUF2911 domain-containing protein [Rufibacter ruber]